MTGNDVVAFLEIQEMKRRRFLEEQELLDQLQTNTPMVRPIWDKSPASVQFNHINPDILKDGLLLYSASLEDVWKRLYKPNIYDADTLWTDIHCKRKIALVISAWESKKPLSPPFFVKHGSESLGLVADGKHRLTVARYMSAQELPFLIPKSESEWVRLAIPNAVEEVEI